MPGTRPPRGPFRVLSLALVVLLSSCPAVADWPQYQHDAAHTGYGPSTLDPRQLAHAWTSPTGYYAPLIQGDTVYAHSRSAVTAFDLATGRQRWSTAVNGAGFLAVFDDMVVTTSYPFSAPKSLQVLDAATGAPRYAVSFGRENEFPGVPVVYEAGGQRTALVMDASGSLFSMRLGETSGSLNWSTPVDRVSGMPPTVAGGAAVVASFATAHMVDLATGAASEPLFRGTLSSASGFPAAYDAARRRVYFVNALSSQRPAVLMAYDYVDSLHASLAWTRDLSDLGMHPALGPEGNVYITDGTTLYEIDPESGRTLRSLPGQSFAYGSTPQISNGYLYDFSGAEQVIYDLESFSLVRTLPGSRGSQNTELASLAAISDDYFAYQALPNGDFTRFEVYRAVPEPGAVPAVGAAGAVLALLRRRRPGRDRPLPRRRPSRASRLRREPRGRHQ